MEILSIEWGCRSRGLGFVDRMCTPEFSSSKSKVCLSHCVFHNTEKVSWVSAIVTRISVQTDISWGTFDQAFQCKAVCILWRNPVSHTILRLGWVPEHFYHRSQLHEDYQVLLLEERKTSLCLDFSLNSKQDYRDGRTPSAHPSTKTVSGQFSDPHWIKLVWFLEEHKIWSLLSI